MKAAIKPDHTYLKSTLFLFFLITVFAFTFTSDTGFHKVAQMKDKIHVAFTSALAQCHCYTKSVQLYLSQV